MRLSDAGLCRRKAKLVYFIHRFPPWLFSVLPGAFLTSAAALLTIQSRRNHGTVNNTANAMPMHIGQAIRNVPCQKPQPGAEPETSSSAPTANNIGMLSRSEPIMWTATFIALSNDEFERRAQRRMNLAFHPSRDGSNCWLDSSWIGRRHPSPTPFLDTANSTK